MHKIKILEGTYKIRGKDVDLNGMVFPLVEEFKFGANGGYVTVDGAAVAGFPDRNIKIKCDSAESYQKVNSNTKITAREESDDEVIDRLRERFNILEDMTRACKKGDVRAMIVSGPPGVGKSFGVEKVLGKHDMIATLGERPAKYQVVKGAMSAIGLYCKLYNYADKDNVLVFDDCDSVLLDDLSLNILKAALDSPRSQELSIGTQILSSCVTKACRIHSSSRAVRSSSPTSSLTTLSQRSCVITWKHLKVDATTSISLLIQNVRRCYVSSRLSETVC